MNEVGDIGARASRSLADALEELKERSRRSAPALFQDAERLIRHHASVGVGEGAPNIGDAMPDFLLPDSEGGLFSLDDVLRSGPAIIVFFRGGWCPYCRTAKRALDNATRDAQRSRVSIVGVSPERATAFEQNESGGCKLLVDVDNGYALVMKLLVWVDDALADVYQRHGYDVSANQVGRSWLLPIPASFLVSREKKIVKRHLDVDYRNRLDPVEFIAEASVLD